MHGKRTTLACSVSLITAIAAAFSVATATAAGLFEAGAIGNVNGTAGDGFTSVGFQQTYSSAPLVFLLSTNQGGDPAAIRINNVTNTGFDAIVVEPPGEDGPHADMDVSYLAVMPGRYEFAGGAVFEAGKHSTTTTVQRSPPFGSAGGHDTVSFSSAFPAPPAVLADIQTMVNETETLPDDPSSPWLTTSVKSISAGNFQVALERAEVNNGATVTSPETIGYFATPQGHGVIDSLGDFLVSGGPVEIDVNVTADVIEGWDDSNPDGSGDTVSFNSPFGTGAPDIVIASLAKRDGVDGGWLRVNPSSVTASGINLSVDEDRFNDGERGHTTESASIVAIEKAFTAATTGNTDVHFDDGSTDTTTPVDGSDGDKRWGNNINWRVNSTPGQQNTVPNNVLPGITDRVNIALNDGENLDQPALIAAGESFEVSSVRIGGNFGLGVGGDGILNVDGGTLTVSGTGAGNGNVELGFNPRDGKLNISGGGEVNILNGGSLVVGIESGNGNDTSELTVTGSSTLNVTGGFNIAGDQNTNADAGTNGVVVIGSGADNPTVNVSGGNTEVARGGTGEFTLNSGTFNQLSNNFVLAQTRNTGSTSNTDAVATVNGGTLNIAGNGQLNMNGGLSVFNHNGGDVLVGGDMQMATANDTTSNATYHLNAGSGILSIGGDLFVGRDRVGVFNYESGNFSIGGAIYLGGFDNSNPNSRPNADGTFNIGVNGSSPTLNTNQFEVGRHNLGVVNQFGGDVTVNGANNLVLSQFVNSDGTYNMMGGTLTVGSPSGSQGNINFNQGVGTFNQTGGVVTVDRNIQMGNNNAAGVATYDISGGSVDVTGGVDDQIRIGITGTGQFIARGNGQVDAGTIHVGQSANNNALSVSENAVVNTGDLNVASGGGSMGTLTQTGGTLNVTDPDTYQVGAGGLGTVAHSGGTANVTGNLNVGTDGTAGDSYTLSGSGVLNFADTAMNTQVPVAPSDISTLTVGPDGTFNFNGGTLQNVRFIDVDPSNSPFTVGDNDPADTARFVIGADGVDPNDSDTVRAHTTIREDGGGSTPIDFVLNSDGTLAVDIFGSASHGVNGEQGGTLMIDPLDPDLDSDILEVTGTATLDGTLDVALNGFEPYPFAWYDVLVADEITLGDDFDVLGVNLARVVDDPFDPTRQILQVAVPEPASITLWSLLGVALSLLGYIRVRRTGQVR